MSEQRLLEKSDSVLWAFTPDGIVLHNFERGLFAELVGQESDIWAYLDGVHSLDAVAQVLVRNDPGGAEHARHLVEAVAGNLVAGGFLVERSS